MQRRVEEYMPLMADEHWAHIEAFVRSTVLAARPNVPYSTKTLLTTLSSFVLWCWQTACVPLTHQDVFAPSLIEEWVTSGCPTTWSAGTQATTRSMLRRVSEALSPDTPSALARPLPGNIGKPPYKPAEILKIRGAAQTTRRKTLDATAICACGFGGGLDRRPPGCRDPPRTVGRRGRRRRPVLARYLDHVADIDPDVARRILRLEGNTSSR